MKCEIEREHINDRKERYFEMGCKTKQLKKRSSLKRVTIKRATDSHEGTVEKGHARN